MKNKRFQTGATIQNRNLNVHSKTDVKRAIVHLAWQVTGQLKEDKTRQDKTRHDKTSSIR